MVTISDFWKYFIVGSVFWVVVDFTTAFNPDVQGWLAHMPLIWLFYLGSPLLFAYLIYVRKWDDRAIFLPLMGVLLVVEILFSNNVLLYTFPIMLVMVPVAIAIYCFITYVPRWLVDGVIGRYAIATACMALVWALVAVLSYKTRISG